MARARRGARLKQVELAAAMGEGVGRSMISMIETGRLLPSFSRAIEAATALDVSLDYLAGLTDDPEPASLRRRQIGRQRPI